ncbi:YncE family protein [Aquitalea magnusonii]|uniref:YncE family protein n=2 Tax=Aquitalea aquatica TaxID=3044273 RepID=A0A838Y7C3_9NEIS|nr:YncE family protein [Aquitalea magnusonii]
MKARKMLWKLVALAALCGASSQAALAGDGNGYYQLQSTLKLSTPQPSWDYLTFDASRQYLFINRHADGVSVVDVKHMQVVKSKIPGTEHAGDTALATAEGLGFTSNEDGSTTLFRLADFSLVKRIKFGSNADGNVYDPVTHRVAFMMGDDSTVLILSARDGSELGRVKVDGEKLERPVADGKGNILFALRDKNRVIRLDMAKMMVSDEWPVSCIQSNSVAIDKDHERIFVGCRGDKPVLLVLDGKNGHQVATLTLGRGVDEVIYDADTKQVFASNGIESNLVVFGQKDPDHYEMTQSVMTRPSARTMAMDPQTKKLYLVTAEGVQDPGKKVNRAPSFFYPNFYQPDSFVLLTYGVGK